jgi:peptide-methionine (S)-S-oxide reductase
VCVGNDVGSQFASVIYYYTHSQREIATRVRDEYQSLLDERRVHYSGTRVVTRVSEATVFYMAESEHQCYLESNPGGYCNHYYRSDELRPPA